MFGKRNAASRVGVLALSREHLTLSIAHREKGGDTSLQSTRVTWGSESSSAFASIGQEELTGRLRELIGEEKLAGTPIHLVLNGDFCVTRTVAGSREQVERELRDLRERCSLYISLGQGPKSYAECLRTIDAKRSQGSMTITNQELLTAITNSAREVGFKVKSIEHSLVALSRAVGQSGLDRQLPAIIVELNQRGIDLGISYQGRLLLDYRPGGLTRGSGEQRQLAEIIRKHLGRIRRYCHRYFQYSGGKLSQVVLCGQDEEIDVLRQHFGEVKDLESTLLVPRQVCPDWDFDPALADDSSLLPTLGTLLHAARSAKDDETPDLLKPLLLSQREPLGPAALKHFWPLAIAAGLTLVAYLAGQYEHWQAGGLAGPVGQARKDAELLASKQVELRGIESRMKSLKKLGDAISPTQWDQLLTDVGGCLPQGTWLESLKVDRNGIVYLFGPSFKPDSVYELVEQLKQLPTLEDVVLEGTRSARIDSGPATLFDVKCTYTGQTRSEGL